MTICKYCGFDSNIDSLVIEGSPCGINYCPIFTCCFEAWKDHKKLCHREE